MIAPVCVWQRLADRFVRAGFRGVVPVPSSSGKWNGARGFCFVGHVASEKNFNFPSFHFRSGFRRRRRLVCVAHITHTQRARQGATGSRKCCLPLGALPNRALACSLSLYVFAILSARCFLTLLFVWALSIAIILASLSLCLSAVLSVCLWLCFVFSQKENKLENQQTVC